MKTVATPGRDPRMELVAKALCRNGFRTFHEPETEGGGKAFVSLCPPGWGEEKLRPEAEKVAPGGVLVGGRIPGSLADFCRVRGVVPLSLLEDADYRAANARATAEGTLAEAICLLPRVLAGERVLVLGYGACGSEIAALFRGAGSDVSVWSHPASLERALAAGFPKAALNALPGAALVINTVPKPDFMPLLAERLSPGTLFLQVASGAVPEGDALAARGIRCVPLPGLPGKVAPESEAKAILKALAAAFPLS